MRTKSSGGTRKRQAAVADLLNVKTFGAAGDGIIDDRTAIQNAINSAMTSGKILYFPTGTYKCTGGLVVAGTGRLSVMGPHRDAATILYTPTSGDLFSCTGVNGVELEKITLQGQNNATQDALVNVNHTSGSGNFRSVFRDVNFVNHWNGVEWNAANSWTMDGCYFLNQKTIALTIANTQNTSLGRNYLNNTQFIGNGTTTIGIVHNSSPMLRIDNCFFFLLDTGYFCQWLHTGQAHLGTVSGDVKICNSHFSNLPKCIFLDPINGDFADIMISNNIIHGQFCIDDNGNPEVQRLFDVCITGNFIGPTTNGIGIRLNAFGFTITGNLIDGGGSTNHTGINLLTNANQGCISGNMIDGPFGVAPLVDNATGTTIFINGNQGLVPAGSTFTAGASSYTYRAGHRKETLYIVQSPGNTGGPSHLC
jgi:hypothetical protein